MGIVIGALGLNILPVRAQMAVVDVKSITQEIKQTELYQDMLSVSQTISSTMNDIKSLVSPITTINSTLGDTSNGSVTQLLQQGFTQISNYQKAAVGAFEQLFDGSNTSMALFHRDVRNAQIRDEHSTSPMHCTALDGGVSTQAAAVQAFSVGAIMGQIHDLRGEAGPGMPSYYGAAQGYASMNQEHISYYCDANDTAANLCAAATTTPDADQQYASLYGSGSYATQAAVNAAKDYAINLIEPVAPAALRGDQLASTQGQEAAVRRRSFNARMSLAQNIVDQQIGMQSPSVPLTSAQQTYLTNMGLPQQTNGSWLQALQIESERRISDVNWNAQLQTMPPASVEREIAIELALNNYLQYQNFKIGLQHTTISATALAEATERDFNPNVRIPVPSMTASGGGTTTTTPLGGAGTTSGSSTPPTP